jgi:hypothetical protein
MTWTSNAEWAPDVYEGSVEGDHVTSDSHETEGQAEGVCTLLNRHGFGGQGKDFPIRTWTEEK